MGKTIKLKNRFLAEAIEIHSPGSLDDSETYDGTGDEFIAFSSGPGGNLKIFGPFPDSETVTSFGEHFCDDNEN